MFLKNGGVRKELKIQLLLNKVDGHTQNCANNLD